MLQSKTTDALIRRDDKDTDTEERPQKNLRRQSSTTKERNSQKKQLGAHLKFRHLFFKTMKKCISVFKLSSQQTLLWQPWQPKTNSYSFLFSFCLGSHLIVYKAFQFLLTYYLFHISTCIG